MNNLFNTIFLCVLTLSVNAQLVLTDNFDYSNNDSLLVNGWSQIGSSGSNPVRANGPSLTFTGYSSASNGVGPSALITTSGQDVFKDATSAITSGSAFASFLVNVSVAQSGGDFFFALLPSTSSTTYTCRVFIKSAVNVGFFNVAVTKNNETPVYAATDFALNATHLFYVEYQFHSGLANDDSVYLYVIPPGSPIPVSKPLVATASGFNASQSDIPSVGRVALRQGASGTSSALAIDGIRLGASWSGGELPVRWKSFTATRKETGIGLIWSTASEWNNSHFEIQRSSDGKVFETIARQKGCGNSATGSDYRYFDRGDINAKEIYYRLKQVDFDGKTMFSAVVNVHAGKQTIKGGMPWPNPFNNKLMITIDTDIDAPFSIKLIDIIGKVYYASDEVLDIGMNEITIPSGNIPNGIYFIRIESNGEVFTRKVIKKESD